MRRWDPTCICARAKISALFRTSDDRAELDCASRLIHSWLQNAEEGRLTPSAPAWLDSIAMPMIDSARHAHEYQGCQHSHPRRDGCRDILCLPLRCQWDTERPPGGVARARCLGGSRILGERAEVPVYCSGSKVRRSKRLCRRHLLAPAAGPPKGTRWEGLTLKAELEVKSA